MDLSVHRKQDRTCCSLRIPARWSRDFFYGLPFDFVLEDIAGDFRFTDLSRFVVFRKRIFNIFRIILFQPSFQAEQITKPNSCRADNVQACR